MRFPVAQRPNSTIIRLPAKQVGPDPWARASATALANLYIVLPRCCRAWWKHLRTRGVGRIATENTMAQSMNRGTHNGDASKSKHADAVRGTVQRQRRIQAETDQRDEQKESQRSQQQQSGGKQQEKPPVQAGLEKEPVNPMPAQHLRKPGNEHELREAPRFLASEYRGSGKLEGMAALITGGDSGIGRSVAVLYAREGADVAIVYLSEHQDAQDTKRYVEEEGRRCLTISGDVRDSHFCEEGVAKTVEEFGRLDVLVNNAAFQQHSEKLEEITDEQLQETLQTNVGGYLHMARAALPHMKEGAS